MHAASFTEVVRQELSRLPLGTPDELRAELIGLVRTAGQLTLAGGGGPPMLSVVTGSGAVARRAHGLLVSRYEARPELKVRARSGVQHAARYALVLGAGGRGVAEDLGILDADGRLLRELGLRRPGAGDRTGQGDSAEVAVSGDDGVAPALLRGALLGGGSVSRPGRPAHLEIGVVEPEVATELAAILEQVVGAPGTVSTAGRARVVLKSGERIAALLAAVGATRAYLEVEERRLRRQLRSEANRLANADRANLRRTIEASAAQVRSVESAIERHGWEGLEEPLREVALVRLANPEASLTELGSLLDPPVGKSAIHRRLARLEALAQAPGDPSGGLER